MFLWNRAVDQSLLLEFLLDYDQGSGTYEGKAKYWGTESSTAGEYEVQIPTSKASVVGDKIGNICDKINMILGKVCSFYSKANEVTRFVSGTLYFAFYLERVSALHFLH